MQPASRPEDLGPIVSQHTVDRGRRFTVGVAALLFGLTMLLCFGIVPDPADGRPGSSSASKVAGTFGGLALCGLMIAVWYLWRAIRGGRGEYFEVRERGLVHGTSRRIDVWHWSDIAGVREINQPETTLRQHLGAQYVCRILLHNGRRFSVTGLTSDHSVLGGALVANCPFLP